MRQMTRTEFASLMARLRAHYQHPVTDDSLWLASVTTYWDALRPLDPDEIRTAFAVAWRRWPDWFPSAGQLLAAIDDTDTKADEAWPELVRLARRSSGDHSNPVAREAIRRMGGGCALGQMRSDELHVWGRKQFREHYRDVVRDRQRERAQRAILGAGEPANAFPAPTNGEGQGGA